MPARRLGWRTAYEVLASRVRRPEWAFMNYGYAPDDDAPRAILEQSDEPDRFCIALYAHTIGDTNLAGRDVLEVGSGRGGGSSYIARYHRPRSITGLDFSSAAVELSRRTRVADSLTFVHGDAEAMPLPDGSVDAVVNIESSHCYGSMDRFLAEVHRVLRPGGTLHFADFRGADDVPLLLDQLRGSGLTLLQQEDITPRVVEALRRDDDRKAELIRSWIPRIAHPAFRRFAAMKGSRGFDAFAAGRTTYLCARLVKAA